MNKHYRIYELFPNGKELSCKSENYSGIIVGVFAFSIKQAYALAYKGKWSNVNEPQGMLWVYNSHKLEYDTKLWNGKTGYHLAKPEHGAGIREVKKWMLEL